MLGTISNRTLWIDEFSTAALAREPNPVLALQYAQNNLGSESLMPGWVVLTSLAGTVFGTSELGLRAPNAIWLALAVILMAGIGTRRVNVGPALAFSMLPFVWYYGHEARPYALQLLLGAFWAWAAWRLTASDWKVGRWALVAATVAMVWSGLTAAIVGVAMSLTFGLLERHHLTFSWRAVRMGLAGAILIGPAMVFYAYAVLIEGASGARLWQVGLANLAFSAYEVFGFVGLGPGRLELRNAGLSGLPIVVDLLRGFQWPLFILGVAWVAMIAVIVRQATLPSDGGAAPCVRRFVIVATASVLAGALALFVAAVIAEFPIWGRHFAPLVPVFAALLGLAYHSLSTRSRKSLRLIAFAALAVVLVASSAQVRFMERHQVEDYRNAVAIANSALGEGLAVDWFAARLALEYYALSGETGGPRVSWPAPEPIDADRPRLIVISKPDIHDPQDVALGAIRAGDVAVDCSFTAGGFTFVVVGTQSSMLCRRPRATSVPSSSAGYPTPHNARVIVQRPIAHGGASDPILQHLEFFRSGKLAFGISS
jgi:MFS family permease